MHVLLASTALALSSALAVAVRADIVSFQDPATGNQGYAAQEFEKPYDWYNTYQMDDLDLGSPGYYLTDATAYFCVGSAEHTFFEFRTYSKLPWSCNPDQDLIEEYHADWARWEGGFYAVHFDLGGDAYSGVIWCTAYTTQPYGQYGADGWWNANPNEPVRSEEFVWHWGAGSFPESGTFEHGFPSDMSWKIEGTPIPEPGFLSLVVSAALSGACLRRKRA